MMYCKKLCTVLVFLFLTAISWLTLSSAFWFGPRCHPTQILYLKQLLRFNKPKYAKPKKQNHLS